MRRYSEAVKADVRRRMSPPHRQSVAWISEELGIHLATLYNWRKAWRLQGEVVPSSEKEPEGLSAADKFTVVLESSGLTPPSSAPTAASGACSRSRWSAGGRRLLPGPKAERAGCTRCQRQAGAHDGPTEGAQEAPRPGPAGDQGTQEGAAAQG